MNDVGMSFAAVKFLRMQWCSVAISSTLAHTVPGPKALNNKPV